MYREPHCGCWSEYPRDYKTIWDTSDVLGDLKKR